MNMGLQFTIQMTERHIRSAARKFFLRKFKKVFLLVGIWGALTLAVYQATREFNGLVGVMLGIFCFIALLSFFLYAALPKAPLARFAKYGGRVDYELTPEVCRTKSGWATAEMKWEVMQELLIYPEIWILSSRYAGYFTLPADQIGNDVKDFLKQKMNSVGGKIE
jgi:hypothetical protein